MDGKYQPGKNRLNDESFQQFLSVVEKESSDYNTDKNLSQLQHPYQPQYKYLVDNENKLTVDFVGKYENLQEDWKTLREKINISKQHRTMKLSRHNVSKRKDYRTYYSDRDAERVYNIYEEDIKLFKYAY